ncbi:MAG: hypothetical protein NC191_01355 [Muribaculaceae bacterium]|nr:hypothetical protein [Muribaculaceae bacterium]
MKILPKLRQNMSRYINKNTVRAKYNRSMDAALVSGLAAAGHGIATATIPGIVPLSHIHPANLTVNIGLWGLYFKNLGSAIVNRIKMQPIRNRAISIKKAIKLASQNIKQD